MTAKPHHIEGGPPKPRRFLFEDYYREPRARAQMVQLYYCLLGQTDGWSLRRTEKGSVEMKDPHC